MQTKDWWKLQKGTGIKVCIPGDLDEYGKQKKRPGIVIKSYPSHVKVQLLSTQENKKDDYYQITTNDKIGYVRPIYHVTISFDVIQSLWFERGKIVSINSNSVFFKKIIEMEYKEIFEKNLDLNFQQQLEERLQKLLEWNKELQEENSILKAKKRYENER